MIDTITPEQEKELDRIAEEWIEIGLSTDTDRPRAEAAVKKMYEIGGLTPPKTIVWYDNPIDAAIYVNKLESRNKGKGSRDTILSNAIYITLDIGWLAFYWAMREVLGLVEETDELEGMWEFAHSASWVFPYEDVAVLVDKGQTISLDERDNLHNETGPCLTFGQLRFYAWHGVDLPEELFEKAVRKELSLADIQAQNNAEIRRALIGLFGEGAYLEKVGAEVIDEVPLDDTTQPLGVRGAKLLRMRDDAMAEPIVVIRMLNTSNGEPYYETVPPNIETCKAAIAWHHWDMPEAYFPDWEA